MNVQIESGVPIPPIARRRGPVLSFAHVYRQMDIGDSFEVECPDGLEWAWRNRANVAAKAAGIAVTMRSTGLNRFRVWRVPTKH